MSYVTFTQSFEKETVYTGVFLSSYRTIKTPGDLVPNNIYILHLHSHIHLH